MGVGVKKLTLLSRLPRLLKWSLDGISKEQMVAAGIGGFNVDALSPNTLGSLLGAVVAERANCSHPMFAIGCGTDSEAFAAVMGDGAEQPELQGASLSFAPLSVG